MTSTSGLANLRVVHFGQRRLTGDRHWTPVGPRNEVVDHSSSGGVAPRMTDPSPLGAPLAEFPSVLRDAIRKAGRFQRRKWDRRVHLWTKHCQNAPRYSRWCCSTSEMTCGVLNDRSPALPEHRRFMPSSCCTPIVQWSDPSSGRSRHLTLRVRHLVPHPVRVALRNHSVHIAVGEISIFRSIGTGWYWAAASTAAPKSHRPPSLRSHRWIVNWSIVIAT